LTKHRDRRLAFPFKKAQAIPKTDEFSFFIGGHGRLEQKQNIITRRNCKCLGVKLFGPHHDVGDGPRPADNRFFTTSRQTIAGCVSYPLGKEAVTLSTRWRLFAVAA
jgi:hypothetical protein